MARENTVLLYSWVTKPPEFAEEDEYGVAECRLDVLAMRKSHATEDLLLRGKQKEDTIPVITHNRTLIQKVKKELIIKGMESCYGMGDPDYAGYMVFIKGTLCTREVTREYICEHCGNIILHEKTIVYVDPIHIKRCAGPLGLREAMDLLEDHIEMGNICMLYGALWRDPEYYRGTIGECKFPVKTVRKRHIWEDPDEKKADYPWVRTFGGKTEEYSQVLHSSSTVYINGAVQARKYKGQKIYCEDCGGVTEISDETAEVIPYLVKYQMNCGDEFGILPDQSGQDENTVILYGWLSQIPDVTDCDSDFMPTEIKLHLRVARKSYETDDPIARGRTEKDTLLVITQKHSIIEDIVKKLTAKQPRPAGDTEPPYVGYMVFVKGTICQKRGKRKITCPNCGEKLVMASSYIYIDPIGIWAEEGPVDEMEAERLLHDNSEISNMAWAHGLVDEDPELYGDRVTECRFPVRLTRIRRVKGKKDKLPADIPWVKTSGGRAAEYSSAVHRGSTVFLNGAIRKKTYRGTELLCGSCGEIFTCAAQETEIIPYQVEYHADCDIPNTYLEEEEVY